MATSRSWSVSASVSGSRLRADAARLRSSSTAHIFVACFIFVFFPVEQTWIPERLQQIAPAFSPRLQPRGDLLLPASCACFPAQSGSGADAFPFLSFFFWS